MKYSIGIDVGTGSARAGIFDLNGKLLASAKKDIQTWKPQPDFVQQSSTDIWSSICYCVKQIMNDSKVSPADVLGLGFDATCSLVVIDKEGAPLTISPNGEKEQNIIVWMDHRAKAETELINNTKNPVLEFVGGQISPEMETPKILWLKKNLSDTYEKVAHFFDLPDYLTFRATGATTRSLCSTVCKMTYLGHEVPEVEGSIGKWDRSYFQQIGLEDLEKEGFSRLGTQVRPMGEPVGEGLGAASAEELGLLTGTAVGVSIIDAHAGGIGMLGLSLEAEEVDFDKRIALIGGTSSCHMAVSPSKRNIPGIWGPYYSAMVPDFWLNEGGQSAVGSLIDHLIFTHAASDELKSEAAKAGISPYACLNQRVANLSKDLPFPAALASDLHVDPDFHGNRSPRANPNLKGSILGLTLSATLDDLARIYLATIDALSYGTRHIIEEMNAKGYTIDTLIMCGGHIQNPLFCQEHADATRCRIIIPAEPESVLLGSAMLGAVASGQFDDIPEAMATMSKPAQIIEPNLEVRAFHDRKYTAYHRLHQCQVELTQIQNTQ